MYSVETSTDCTETEGTLRKTPCVTPSGEFESAIAAALPSALDSAITSPLTMVHNVEFSTTPDFDSATIASIDAQETSAFTNHSQSHADTIDACAVPHDDLNTGITQTENQKSVSDQVTKLESFKIWDEKIATAVKNQEIENSTKLINNLNVNGSIPKNDANEKRADFDLDFETSTTKSPKQFYTIFCPTIDSLKETVVRSSKNPQIPFCAAAKIDRIPPKVVTATFVSPPTSNITTAQSHSSSHTKSEYKLQSDFSQICNTAPSRRALRFASAGRSSVPTVIKTEKETISFEDFTSAVILSLNDGDVNLNLIPAESNLEPLSFSRNRSLPLEVQSRNEPYNLFLISKKQHVKDADANFAFEYADSESRKLLTSLQNPNTFPVTTNSTFRLHPLHNKLLSEPVSKANEKTMYLKIPADKAGLVLGKTGATILRIVEKSGERVNLIECRRRETMRPVHITGTEEAVAMAWQLTKEILEEQM
ncbi:hypothetical protein HK098_008166 [Nowakowskiella sp. JEL0407]|nr:hypothetical protein HK098_008166 [Nowakowskiella sp. JEL0407]